MKYTLKDNNLIYDVGMHKGEDTDYYLKKGFNVIAFEANPNLVSYCRTRFATEICAGRLYIVEGAILDSLNQRTKNEKVKFFVNKDNSVWGTVVDEWAARNEHLGTSNEIIEVPVVDFSECLGKFGIPYYLKIDIEGMDVVCLKALKGFDQRPDYISIESEKKSFTKLKMEFDHLSSLGYDKFQAINQALVPLQREPAGTKQGQYSQFSFQSGATGLFGTDISSVWKSRRQILRKYRLIFIAYQLFGDESELRRVKLGNRLVKFVNTKSNWSVPGWFDTHARHSSVRD